MLLADGTRVLTTHIRSKQRKRQSASPPLSPYHLIYIGSLE